MAILEEQMYTPIAGTMTSVRGAPYCLRIDHQP